MSEGWRPFAPKGAMSQKAACLEIFRGLAEGEWVQDDDLTDRVADLTQVDVTDAYQAARAAARELAANKEGAWVRHMGGWKHARPEEQVRDVVRRNDRAKRAVRWTGVFASNALSNEAITGPERHQMEVMHRTLLAQQELAERRANRRRPLPPSQSQPEVTSG